MGVESKEFIININDFKWSGLNERRAVGTQHLRTISKFD